MTYRGPLYDYHVHSRFSYDCEAEVDDICAHAIAYGAAGLMFTEHTELEDYNGYDYIVDYQGLTDALKSARQKFPQLILGCGTELGLRSRINERCQQEIDRHPWDFVIGSTHFLDDKVVFNGEFSVGRPDEAVYRDFLQKTYQALVIAPRFDVLGHLDLIRRDASIKNKELPWQSFPDELDAILRLLIHRGIGLEINTAALRYGLTSMHPHVSVLKRYRELGGEILTCGSDCHHAIHTCCDLREAYQKAVDCGFRYISTFEQRVLKQLPIK